MGPFYQRTDLTMGLFCAGEAKDLADTFERNIFFDGDLTDPPRKDKTQHPLAFLLVRHHGFQNRDDCEIEFLDRDGQFHGSKKLHLPPREDQSAMRIILFLICKLYNSDNPLVAGI